MNQTTKSQTQPDSSGDPAETTSQNPNPAAAGTTARRAVSELDALTPPARPN